MKKSLQKTFTLIILAVLFLSGGASAQFYSAGDLGVNGFYLSFFTEKTAADDSVDLTIFNRISNSLLIFEKALNGKFTASFRISYELLDTTGSIVYRGYLENKREVTSFSETSGNSSYTQTFATVRVPAAAAFLRGSFTDQTSSREIPLRIRDIRADDFQFIIAGFNGSERTTYLNFSNAAPFNNIGYKIALYLKQAPDDKPEFFFRQKDKDYRLNPEFTGNGKPVFSYADTSVALDHLPDHHNIWVVPSLQAIADEGKGEILVITGGKDTLRSEISCYWINRPAILVYPELAVRALRIIEESDSEISAILRAGDENMYDAIKAYWKKKDPTPGTLYNELMDVFFTRVEYAADAFMTLDRKIGFDTDRGKTYIKYGPADEIKKLISTEGYPVEIWNYKKSNTSFYFADRTRDGSFRLEGTK